MMMMIIIRLLLLGYYFNVNIYQCLYESQYVSFDINKH